MDYLVKSLHLISSLKHTFKQRAQLLTLIFWVAQFARRQIKASVFWVKHVIISHIRVPSQKSDTKNYLVRKKLSNENLVLVEIII